jgi:hypothetical protein
MITNKKIKITVTKDGYCLKIGSFFIRANSDFRSKNLVVRAIYSQHGGIIAGATVWASVPLLRDFWRKNMAATIESLKKPYFWNEDGLLKPMNGSLSFIAEYDDFVKKTNDFKKAIIVDLGGTLAHRVERPKEAYKDRFHEDIVDHVVKDIVNMFFDSKHMVIILTGINEDGRESVEEWLHHNGVGYDFIFMKNKIIDNRDTLDFKKWVYNVAIKPNIDVSFVLEDREDVVEMWRNMGVKCLQTASGQDREYYRNKEIKRIHV